MTETLDFNKVVENVVSSYEAKIDNINSFFETTRLIVSEFQDPLFDTKQERDQINGRLQDLLARNEHLRRTDFNRMMQGILASQVEKEKEIRNLVNSFLNEQKETVILLRDNFIKIKEALAKGEGVKIKESQRAMVDILAQQDKRRLEVSLKLKEFQKEQKEMILRLQELLTKGKELRIKDLKLMLEEFNAQHKKRLAQHEERKVEVRKRRGKIRGMLIEFKEKRKESVKSQRVDPAKAILPVRRAQEVNKDNSFSNPLTSFGISPEQGQRANGVYPVRDM
ncbi:MAG: hypothetical protein ABIC68_04305 [Candidatus Omnitrophota bacterium]